MKTNNPVLDKMLSMTIPAVLAMLITFIFQLADTYFVGKLGTTQLAAMSFSFPIYMLIISLFMGIAAGVSATVAKALGENNEIKSKALTTISLLLFMIFSGLLGFAGYFNIDTVFSLLGADTGALVYINEYMEVLYLGIFLLVGTLIGNAALMAKGIMIRTTIVMGFGGLVNIILDYFLIFGIGFIPEMGIQGAAVATVLSWFISFILMFGLLLKYKLISLKAIGSLRVAGKRINEILTIGIPAVVAQILNPIAISVITRVVSRSGDDAVAAYGIVTKVESLGLTVILALSVILTPLAGRFFGAKEDDNLDQVVALSGRITVYWGIILYIIFLLTAPLIISVFTDNANIINYSKSYLYIVGLSLPAFGLTLITTSFFNGVQQPRFSLKLTLIKSVFLTLPFAVAGSFLGLNVIWTGLALANIIGSIYAGKLLSLWQKKNNSRLYHYNPLKDYLGDLRKIISLFR
jgi:MATE family, multidrug efflux pump